MTFLSFIIFQTVGFFLLSFQKILALLKTIEANNNVINFLNI